MVNDVVFADPNNQAAKDLQADALEQLGYQSEAGPWRNFYLTGAQELRRGVQKLPTPNTASPDMVRAQTLDMFFDYLGVRLNSAKAGDAHITINFDFGAPEGTYLVEVENGVLNHTAGAQANDADATIKVSREVFNDIALKKITLDKAIADGNVKIEGDADKLSEIMSMLDTFEFWFPIVTPARND